MGVYLENTSTPHVPTPLNVADALYNRDRPNIPEDVDVQAGQAQSETNASGVVSATPNSLVARDSSGRSQISDPSGVNDIANKNYVDSQVSTRALSSHSHEQSKVVGLVARLQNIEARLDAAGIPPA